MSALWRPIISKLGRPLTSAVTDGLGGGFSPLTLFSAGEQGAIFDNSNLASMFQDAAGTIPAVVDGVVGKQLDLSGRGNHRTQATTAQKPILRTSGGLYWLEYDGVDDGMVTAAVNLSGTNKLTVWCALYKASDATVGSVIESGNSGTDAGGFGVFAPVAAATANVAFRSAGTLFTTSTVTAAASTPLVIVGQGDISAPSTLARVNGVDGTPSVASQGTGNYANRAINFGRRSGTSLPFGGREYFTVIRGAASTAAQIAATERIAATKSGASF